MGTFRRFSGLALAEFGNPSPASGLPRRTIVALTAGFAIVACGTVFFGPAVRSVLADEQDQRAVYLNILAHERGQARPRTTAIEPARAQPAAAGSLFGLLFGNHRPQQPSGALAYAPPDQPIARPRARRANPANFTAANIRNSGGGLSRRSVCVRLCDGYAFPVADYSGDSDDTAHSAICAGLCPGAATRLYTAPAGSDKIEDAVSTLDGSSYSSLKTAFHYTSAQDGSCSCHPIGETALKSVSVLKDFTLRAGDLVMTETGFQVFQGAAAWPYGPRNFAPLLKAGLERRQLASLAAMESVSRKVPSASEPGPAARSRKRLAQTPQQATARPNGPMRIVGPQVFATQNNDDRQATP